MNAARKPVHITKQRRNVVVTVVIRSGDILCTRTCTRTCTQTERKKKEKKLTLT